jgi:hypothetical protein
VRQLTHLVSEVQVVAHRREFPSLRVRVSH